MERRRCELDVLINTHSDECGRLNREIDEGLLLFLLSPHSCFLCPVFTPHLELPVNLAEAAAHSLSQSLYFFFLFQTSELSPISLQIQFNHLINPQKTNTPSPSFFNMKDQITPKSNSIYAHTHLHLRVPSFYFSNWPYEDRAKQTT